MRHRKNPPLGEVRQIGKDQTLVGHGSATILFYGTVPVAVWFPGSSPFASKEASPAATEALRAWVKKEGFSGPTYVPQQEIFDMARTGKHPRWDPAPPFQNPTRAGKYRPNASGPWVFTSAHDGGDLILRDYGENPGTDLVGYIKDAHGRTETRQLTDGNGKPLGWFVDSIISNWRLTNGDRVYAVRLRSEKGNRWAGGYWLGDGGTLFRGEIVGRGELARQEASDVAFAFSERQIELDAEEETLLDDLEHDGDRYE